MHSCFMRNILQPCRPVCVCRGDIRFNVLIGRHIPLPFTAMLTTKYLRFACEKYPTFCPLSFLFQTYTNRFCLYMFGSIFKCLKMYVFEF